MKVSDLPKRRNGFYYGIPDTEDGYISVTNVLKTIPKEGLNKWTLTLVAKEALKHPEKSVEELIRAPYKIMAKAGAEGSLTHDVIDKMFKKEELGEITDKVQGYINSYSMFNVLFPNEPISSEQMIFSHKHKFAGTMDRIIQIKGQKWLIDWKTGNNLYKEHEVQLVAYREAVLEMGLVDKIDEMVLVQLIESGKPTVKFVSEIDENGWDLFEIFLLTKKMRAWHEGIPVKEVL